MDTDTNVIEDALQIDLAEAQRFLKLLDPEANEFTFQIFDDSDLKRTHLARIFHGTLEQYAPSLSRLNERGAGIFVTINKTDLHGRSTENVIKVRKFFVDTDGAQTEPISKASRDGGIQPSCVVESSPGNFHVYWGAVCELGDFKPVQSHLAVRFGTDSSVHDLPRVLRLPGFYHLKRRNGAYVNDCGPFRVRIIKSWDNAATYTPEEMIFGLGLEVEKSNASNTSPSNSALGSNLDGRDFAYTAVNMERIKQGLNMRTNDAGWNDREKWLDTLFAVRSLRSLAGWPEDKVWELFNVWSKRVNAGDNKYDESGNRKAWDAPERKIGKLKTFASILDDAKPATPAPLPPVNASGIPSLDDAGQAWPMPQPLTERIEANPYPIDALPDTIRAAVEEVGSFVKAPVPLVASSAIAALSLAIQPHADVQRADKLHSPVSTFTLVIADSGERKSTCDGFFTKAIRDYEAAQVDAAKPLVKDYNAAISAWDAKHNGIKDKIRRLAKDKKPTAELENDLRELGHNKPMPPQIPRLIYGDVTPEELAYKLANDWPSGGVMSAEAGIVFGSHGMGKDSVTRNLARLNVLWDGGELPIDRRTTESFTVRGARLTMGLQVQSATLLSFFEKSGALARGTGFLARFLIAWPESTQGNRLFTEAPEHWPSLAAFNRRITAILNLPAPIDENGTLTPQMLTLTPEAKTAWISYHDGIERELASGGELYDVRDVASKSADNAARLAALFHVFEGGLGAIGADAFERASRIAAWHLNESRRFFGELALPVEMADAARLDRWLIEHCRQGHTHCVGKRYTRQHGPIRDGGRLDVAISELVSLDRIQLRKDGKQLSIWLNPALMAEGSAS